MPTIVALRLPWGQYHATPWGRSVNESAVEWPPSPWRILRALYCTWRFRAPDLSEGRVMRLLEALAAPPSYLLPRHHESHTRHYMPDVVDHRDKVFDPFVVTARGAEVLVQWDASLDAEATGVLTSLLDQMPYLGRAESVCIARLVDDPPGDARWLSPAGEPSETTALTRLLAAVEPLDAAALIMTTTAVRGAGRVVPPGTRWVGYDVPPIVVGGRPPVRPRRAAPEVIRLVVDPLPAERPLEAGAGGSAQPSLYAAVAACDLLRSAVMRAHGTPPSSTLAGKDRDGIPLVGHRHAHYLALDLDRDRLLDHLVVWAPDGLSDAEIRAVTGLRRLSTAQRIEGFHPLRLTLEAAGSAATAVPELLGPSRAWTSHTPFAPPRHQSRKQDVETFLAAEITRELEGRALPRADIEPVSGEWLRFRRRRRSEHLSEDRRAFGLRLRFAEPVRGPLCLGALSHFGLGLFEPETGD